MRCVDGTFEDCIANPSGLDSRPRLHFSHGRRGRGRHVQRCRFVYIRPCCFHSNCALSSPCTADCAYCLLETIDYAHGAGFVKSQLRLFTDYPILARHCVPQLAAVLAAAQHTAVAAALSLGVAFGLSAPDAAVADLFLPAQGGMHSQAPWYRGLNRNEYLYRCGGNQTAEETWVVTKSRDEDAWSRCEGRVWIDLGSARARTDATDRLSAVGGVFFDLSLRQCGEEFARIQSHNSFKHSKPQCKC